MCLKLKKNNLKTSLAFFIIFIGLTVGEQLFCYSQELNSKTADHKKTTAEPNNSIKHTCREYGVLAEYKPVCFYYQDKTFRRIFNDIAFLSIFGFDIRTWENLHVWLDAGYLYDKGKVREADYAKTTISLVPISFGLKYQCLILRILSPYIKLGINQFYIKNKNYYPYVERKVTKHFFGFTVGTGCLINLYKGLSLDLTGDYLYNKRKFISRDSNLPIKVYVGGIAFGAGLGYQF